MNTGTRLTLLQSKGLNIYAVKMGTGWELHIHDDNLGDVIKRELSSRRVQTLLTALSQVDIDQTGPPSYTPADPFYDTSDETLDRVFGPPANED